MSDLNVAYAKNLIKKRKMTYPERHLAKMAFSRFFLGFVLMYLATQVFADGLVFCIKLILPLIPTEIAAPVVSFLNDYYITTFIVYAFMYLLAFPLILYPMVKNLPAWDKRCDGMPKARILGLFCILQFTNIPLAYLGVYVNDLIASLIGTTTEPVFSDIPLWVLTILSLIFAPIFEELIFRKVLMDKIGVYGERLAIIVSALSFGAFHGNFQQFFFTVIAGAALAVVYAKTKRIIFPIILHFLNNAYGIFQQYILESDSLDIAVITEEIRLSDLIISLIAYALFISGLVLFIIALAKRWFNVSNSPDTVYITQSRARIMFFNIGSLTFTAYIIYTFMTSFMSVSEWINLIKGLIIGA